MAETQPYSNGWVGTGNVCEFAFVRAGPQRGRKVFPQERARLRERTLPQVSKVRNQLVEGTAGPTGPSLQADKKKKKAWKEKFISSL